MKQSKLHRLLAYVWLLLIIPTVTVWADAVWWIGIISIYANAVTHWDASLSAKAKEKMDEEDG